MRNYDPNDVNEPDFEYEPEEVELCECGGIANHSHQVQVKFSEPPRDETINFCDDCEAIAAEIIGEIEFRAAAMVKDGAD